MRRLHYEDGAFKPDSDHVRELFEQTSGGHGEIVLDRYDALVIYAMGLSFAAIVDIAAKFGTASHLHGESDGTLVSSACFSRIIDAAIAQSGTMNCLSQLRPEYGRPVFVCATPLPPARLFQESRSRLPPRFADDRYLVSLFTQFQWNVESACAEFEAEMVWQDDRTFEPPCFTKTEFSYGALTGRGAVREEYNKHMNEEFGAIALENIFTRLNRKIGRRTVGTAAADEMSWSSASLAALSSQ